MTATTLSDAKRPPKRRWLIVLALLLSVLGYLSGSLEFIESEITDLKFAVTGRAPSGDIVFVGIDTRSIRKLGAWPWPRTLHAAVLDRLMAAGARKVVFDIDFSSPSTVAVDAALERSLAAANGAVVLAAHVQRGPGGDGSIFTMPLPRLARHADIASMTVHPAADGLIRQMIVRQQWPDRLMPSVAALLADRVDAPFTQYDVDFAIDAAALPYLSFADVATGRFDPEAVRNKAVIVGAAAIELGDQLPVPIYKSLSGSRLLALGYESLLQDRALRRLGRSRSFCSPAPSRWRSGRVSFVGRGTWPWPGRASRSCCLWPQVLRRRPCGRSLPTWPRRLRSSCSSFPAASSVTLPACPAPCSSRTSGCGAPAA